MFEKELLGLIAALIAVGSKIPYVIAIYQGRKKPHIFTWIIWTITTAIIFLGQFLDGAGAGAWSTAMGTLICITIVILSYRKNPYLLITRADWLSLFAAVGSVALWALTQNPLWAMIILVAIDVIGYFPTLRKAYALPDEECGWIFFWQNVKHVFSIAAMHNYSVITLMFPVTIFIMNALVPIVIVMGKKQRKVI